MQYVEAVQETQFSGQGEEVTQYPDPESKLYPLLQDRHCLPVQAEHPKVRYFITFLAETAGRQIISRVADKSRTAAYIVIVRTAVDFFPGLRTVADGIVGTRQTAAAKIVQILSGRTDSVIFAAALSV